MRNQATPMNIDPPEHDDFARKALEAAIRIGLVALLVAWCWDIVHPFVTPVAWGVILAIAMYPAFHALANGLGGRGTLAATLVTLVALVVFVGPIGMLVTTLLNNLQTLAADLSAGALSVPPPPESVAGWPIIGAPLDRIWGLASVNLSDALHEFEPQLSALGRWLLGFVAGLGLGFLQFLIAIVIAGLLLARAAAGERAARAFATRVAGEDRGPGFVDLATMTIRAVARGVLGIALVQATLAGIGLVVAGVPFPGLLAFLVFLLSALQIGPGLVLIPAIIYVFVTADLVTWILFAAWTIPVTLLDNVLKPIVLGRGAGVPMLVIFVGVIGGTLASGIIGMFIGPVVLALGYKLLFAWILGGPEQALASFERAREERSQTSSTRRSRR
jgi:predicted PurR-regulated permease PerM